MNVAKLVVYEKDLPNEGALVLKDFKARVNGTIVTFLAGDIISAPLFANIYGDRSHLPIRDLSQDPPTKSKSPIVVGVDSEHGATV